IIHRILKEVLREGSARGAQAPGSPDRAGFARAGVEVPSPAGSFRSSQPGAAALHRRADAGPSPWSQRRDSRTEPKKKKVAMVAGLSEEALHDIAESSSQTERAADDAERELLEWKKVKFIEDRLGKEFAGLIVSVTKFGFFVELTDLFIEGLVPLDSLEDDHYTFRESTRQIIGARTRNTYSIGDKVRVQVDRIDPVAHKIQFALVEERPKAHKKSGKRK